MRSTCSWADDSPRRRPRPPPPARGGGGGARDDEHGHRVRGRVPRRLHPELRRPCSTSRPTTSTSSSTGRARFDIGRESFALYPAQLERKLEPGRSARCSARFRRRPRSTSRTSSQCAGAGRTPTRPCEMGNHSNVALAMALESIRTGEAHPLRRGAAEDGPAPSAAPRPPIKPGRPASRPVLLEAVRATVRALASSSRG